MTEPLIQPGRLAGRYLKSLTVCNGNSVAAQEYVTASRWAGANTLKDALGAVTTGGGGLSYVVQRDFVELVYPSTIFGKLLQVRRVPFDIATMQQIAGTRSYWVKESAPTPIALPTYTRLPGLQPYRLGSIVVATQESVRFDMSEDWIIDDLSQALVTELDAAFIDPDNAGVPGEKPASIANTAITITGTSDPIADIKTAVRSFNGKLTYAAWVLHPDTAADLALRGEPFNKLGVLGGEILGLPAITSESVRMDSSGSSIVLLDQSAIQVSGDKTARLETSEDASLLMSDDPESGDAELVSMFQTNSMAMQGQIIVSWRNVRPAGSVVVIEGVNYGS